MKKTATGLSKVQRDRAPRIRSSLPVVMNGKRGITEDISATGVFFEIEDEQTVGSLIHFCIELETPGGKLNVDCEAEVIRLQQIDGKTKVAAKILNQTIQQI